MGQEGANTTHMSSAAQLIMTSTLQLSGYGVALCLLPVAVALHIFTWICVLIPCMFLGLLLEMLFPERPLPSSLDFYLSDASASELDAGRSVVEMGPEVGSYE